MNKSLFAVIAAVSFLSISPAGAGNGVYPFGDPPYRLNWWHEPQIEQGCWKWNWQLYHWEDYCPAYVYPKAYMYPRRSAVVLRTKG